MPFLKDCLYSIIHQTFTDWELIAVDDYSTDDSHALLSAFAAEDNRIKVLKNNEKGIIPALRLAFATSRGQCITRMDADDKMTTNKLSVLFHSLQEKGKGYLATAYVAYFSEHELGQGYQNYAQWLNILTQDSRNFDEIYKECVIPSPCWMLHRDDLLACGAFAANTYPEDYDLCFRFYQQGLKVIGNKVVLHHWRDHSNRSSRTLEVYSNNQYFELKIPYFLRLDYKPKKVLILWGAGKKGKQIAQLLLKNDVKFKWVCNTPRRWGTNVYNVILEPTDTAFATANAQIIVAVSSPEDQKNIKTQLLKTQKEHYFFT